MNFDKKVTLHWHNDYEKVNGDEPITCKFRIDYPEEGLLIKESIEEAVKWLGVNNSSLKIINTDEKWALEIKGRGHDSRCMHCRQLRTRLRHILEEKGIKLRQPKNCRFDEYDEYGESRKEKLMRKIKKFEEGLDEENTEEDYYRWVKSLEEIEDNFK